MSAIDTVVRSLKEVGSKLDAPDLDPDSARRDWPAQHPRLDAMRDALLSEALGLLDAAVAEDPRAGDEARGRVAALTGEVAALFYVAGRHNEAADLLARAVRAAPAAGGLRAELEAAGGDWLSYAALVRGRWLHGQGRQGDGDRALKQARKSAVREVREAAVQELATPRPLTGGPPAMFSLYGFGVDLYGERDHGPDGAYVATHCLTALFVPVVPLAAYRIRRNQRGIEFLSRAPLSPFARVARAVAALVTLVAVGLGGTRAWRNSPTYRAQTAIAHAQAEERAGHAGAALAEYERALRAFAGHARASAVSPGAVGWVRVASAAVHEPCDPEHVADASGVVLRYEALPAAARSADANALLTRNLARWARQIGDGNVERAEAALRLATLAARVAPDRERATRDVQARHAVLAAQLANDWPLEALGHYVAAGDDTSTRAAVGVVQTIARAPSLALAAEPDLTAWTRVAEARDASLAGAVSAARAALATARETTADGARNAALVSGDRAALEAALQRWPADQDALAALSTVRRDAGDAAGALATLAALGGPGRMTPVARRALALALAESGQLAEADRVLTRDVSARLTAFHEVREAYRTTRRIRAEALEAQLRSEHPPADLVRQVEALTDEQRGPVIAQWFSNALAQDAQLAALQQAYERDGAVVPAALALGTIKLRRARETPEPDRSRLLAEAEHVLLAIREEAADAPAYGLNLGQVYHRLGRTADGEREFATVLAAHDPARDLAVAHVYRELGLVTRAREVAEATYTGSHDEEVRAEASIMMSLMADRLEDEELWLRRAPADRESVRVHLRQVEAEHFLRDRRLVEADRAFAEVAASWARSAATDASAANNSAIAEQARYHCTGDVSRLRAAVEGLESARRMAPDNALTVGNLAEALEHQGRIAVLEGFVRTATLRMSSRSAGWLIDALAGGSSRDAVLTAVRRDAPTRRSLELRRQHQVLAPQHIEAYESELEYYELLEDEAALRGLDVRLVAVGPLDGSQRVALQQRWVRGDDDARMRQTMDATVSDAETVLVAAQRTHHAPTIAAAHLLHAMALLSRSRFDTGTGDVDAAVAAMRAAAATWPALGVRSSLAWTLVRSATMHAKSEVPALAEADRAEGRIYSFELWLRRAANGPHGDAVRAAVRARPETAEAIALLRETPPERLGSSAWLLAPTLGDPVLEERAAVARTRPTVRLGATIRARLAPDDADARESLLLLPPL